MFYLLTLSRDGKNVILQFFYLKNKKLGIAYPPEQYIFQPSTNKLP